MGAPLPDDAAPGLPQAFRSQPWPAPHRRCAAVRCGPDLQPDNVLIGKNASSAIYRR